MASRAAGLKPPFTEATWRAHLAQATGGALSGALFAITGSVDPDPNFVWSGLVMAREGGFMMVVPVAELVHQAILDLVPAESAADPAFFQGEIQLLGAKGKVVGAVQAELVDFPWAFVGNFSQAVQFRGSQAAGKKVLGFSGNGFAGKPSAESVYALASVWLEEMDPATAQEYVTGEEFDEAVEAEVPNGAPDPDVVQQLQKRVLELESALQQRPSAMPLTDLGVAPPPPTAAARSKAAGLFSSGNQQSVSPADWQRLQTLAGAPPPRVASVENRRPTSGPILAGQETLYAEVEKEALEDDVSLLMDPALMKAAQNTMDPVQQILWMQLQQNQTLLQRLVGARTQDPVLKALGGGSGGDNASGSGSSGVRGCLARDVFIKAAADLPTVSTMVRTAAIKELGISESRADSNLLRKYMERRIPLAEHRLLSQMATLVTEGWSVGFQNSDELLMGFMSKMLIFIEQCALDQGRSQFAWLLTGIQEVPAHMLVSSRRKPGMEPFSRLCSPSWISANLQYVRDLDYMEARMSTMAGGKPSKTLPADDADGPPKAKAKTRPKGKGRGNKGQQIQEQEPAEGA